MNFLKQHIVKQNLFKKVFRACQHLLLTSMHASKARVYVNSRFDYESVIRWKFGYFPSDEWLSELTSLVTKQDLELLNLYYPKFLAGGYAPHGHFSDHNLILPFFDVNSDVIGMLGRCLLDEKTRKEHLLHKYKYSSGCQKDLYVYGLDKAKKSIIENNYVIGVEGQFDCISLHEKGITNSVAFGCANVSKYQLFQLHRYTNNIILMFDNDNAGKSGKNRVKNRYRDVANIKVISPPDGFKDIDEFFRSSNDTTYIKYVIDKIKSFGEMNGKKV